MMDDWKPSHAYHKINIFLQSAKMNGTQRRALVSLDCMYSGIAKGTSWAEVISNSEKIKPVALAIVELCQSEGIRQAGI